MKIHTTATWFIGALMVSISIGIRYSAIDGFIFMGSTMMVAALGVALFNYLDCD